MKKFLFHHLYLFFSFVSLWFDNRYIRKYKIFFGTSLLIFTNACQGYKNRNTEVDPCHADSLRIQEKTIAVYSGLLPDMPEDQTHTTQFDGSLGNIPENNQQITPQKRDSSGILTSSGTIKEIQEYVPVTCYDLSPVELTEDDTTVYVQADEMPEFPGGPDGLKEYIKELIRYPLTDFNVQGRVIVSFIIEKDGTISNPEIVRSLEPAFDQCALDLIHKMPLWKPGRNNGTEVRVKYFIPVRF